MYPHRLSNGESSNASAAASDRHFAFSTLRRRWYAASPSSSSDYRKIYDFSAKKMFRSLWSRVLLFTTHVRKRKCKLTFNWRENVLYALQYGRRLFLPTYLSCYLQSVWPDVGIKIKPNLSKSYRKSRQRSCFLKKCHVSKYPKMSI